MGGRIRLYCKGADSIIVKMLDPKGKSFEKETLIHLNDMGSEGLRFLIFLFYTISELLILLNKKNFGFSS